MLNYIASLFKKLFSKKNKEKEKEKNKDTIYPLW
jgi:hypothetical protein